jgi:hypothetical protein
MTEEELKAYRRILEKFKESRRAAETPEQAMERFEKYIKETIASDMSTKPKN